MSISLIQAARKLVKDYGVKGELLHEAIPYLNKFSGKTFVLKIGGSILDSMLVEGEQLVELANDIAFLKAVGINTIIVHGGGKLLDAAMQDKGIKPEKINGLRVTSLEVASMAKEVFNSISVALASHLENCGYNGVIFQSESDLVKSKQINQQLQAVGCPVGVDAKQLTMLDEQVVPIISAITASADDIYPIYNVNADDVASHIAAAINAEKLILMTDVEGVLNKDKQLLSVLSPEQVNDLIADETIYGGMLPKVSACLHALNQGVTSSHIIKGDNRSFMDEILTDSGVGTQFIQHIEPTL